MSGGPPAPRQVFLAGSTGYVGRALSAALIARGHQVDGLCRPGSESRLVRGVTPIRGDPLDATTYQSALRADHVVVHLVGTPRPAPWKAVQFERVDLGSVLQLVNAVRTHTVAHIVYMSVAHPAPVMHAYVNVRVRAEAALRTAGPPLTILRPWYVLGPGHRWAYALLPVYWLAERSATLRDGALRLGLVTLEQMVTALVASVETAGADTRILDVPAIRSARLPT